MFISRVLDRMRGPAFCLAAHVRAYFRRLKRILSNDCRICQKIHLARHCGRRGGFPGAKGVVGLEGNALPSFVHSLHMGDPQPFESKE